MVPELVGESVSAAQDLARAQWLIVVSDDPDGPPLHLSGSCTITHQQPPPGSSARREDHVVVRFRDGPGDGGGVREPRHPRSGPLAVGVDPADLGNDVACAAP